MRTFRTFFNFFAGEVEVFLGGYILIIFLTIISMSFSMNQFFGMNLYLSRFFVTIFISMIVGGISIQISTVKRLSDGYGGYLYSSISAIANSFAVFFEAIEMIMYGTNWFEFEFLRVQSDNPLMYFIGFMVFLYSGLMAILSILDLIFIVNKS
ncbi:hypothetical protein [Athalassotoga saccharophila]|uniref:hypothetical protein n=1 Tax=Athalassotoga saccharophila TaxID=1441386 RepID=UPI0013798A76|nr:hypothetical protein [Athalassotoga saccharophila]BBJ27548.1 hypothetical protein ATHSA_0424 [Athalassotoga saccharophila]